MGNGGGGRNLTTQGLKFTVSPDDVLVAKCKPNRSDGNLQSRRVD